MSTPPTCYASHLPLHRAGEVVVRFHLPNDNVAVFVIVPVVPRRRRLSFTVIIPRSQGQATIRRSDRNLSPLACRALIIYTRQTTATIERIRTNSRYAVGNSYTRQLITMRERTLTDTRYAVGNYCARQTTAIMPFPLFYILVNYTYITQASNVTIIFMRAWIQLLPSPIDITFLTYFRSSFILLH